MIRKNSFNVNSTEIRTNETGKYLCAHEYQVTNNLCFN